MDPADLHRSSRAGTTTGIVRVPGNRFHPISQDVLTGKPPSSSLGLAKVIENLAKRT
jgi:hypothetical protein